MCVFAYYGLCIIFFELAHCCASRDLVSTKSHRSNNFELTATSIEEARPEKDRKKI